MWDALALDKQAIKEQCYSKPVYWTVVWSYSDCKFANNFFSVLIIYFTYYADRVSSNDSSIHVIISVYIIITSSFTRLHNVYDEFSVMRF